MRVLVFRNSQDLTSTRIHAWDFHYDLASRYEGVALQMALKGLGGKNGISILSLFSFAWWVLHEADRRANRAWGTGL